MKEQAFALLETKRIGRITRENTLKDIITRIRVGRSKERVSRLH